MSIQTIHSLHTLVIRRQRDISGTDRTSLHATATVDAPLQTLSREARVSIGLGLDERPHVAWFEIDQNIKEGDHITITGPTDQHFGHTYTVREITIRDYGINQHIEALLTEFNE